MKKTISILSAAAALSVLTALPFSANAAEIANTGDYVSSIYLDRYAMTAEEAASGDASVGVSAYIRGTARDGMVIKSAQYEISHDNQIYLRNLVDPTKTDTEAVYSSLGNEFTTAYNPFCFGSLSNGVYSANSFLFTGRDYCMDPVSGNVIKYLGNDTISFKLPGRYYVDEEGNLAQDKVSHEIVCPLTVNEDGSATYTFMYADIYYDHVDVAQATGVIPYYQPEKLSENDFIPDINSKFSWVADADSKTFFLGNSNDFPIMQADAFIKKGTPCGIYNFSINEDFCSFSVDDNSSSCHLPVKYQGAAIAVGVEAADMSAGGIMPVYACYFADDTKTITGASVGVDYICDVSYTDGTSETEKNVTGAVNAGKSPNEIMSSINGTYFIDDIPMYCGDTPLTYNGKENSLKVLIGTKGDANLDGVVNVADAAAVLSYYAQKAGGITPDLVDSEAEFADTLAFFLGDIDTESQTMDEGGTLDLSDAANILTYYSNAAAGNVISWDKFLK